MYIIIIIKGLLLFLRMKKTNPHMQKTLRRLLFVCFFVCLFLFCFVFGGGGGSVILACDLFVSFWFVFSFSFFLF